jgi:hypothetical protein
MSRFYNLIAELKSILQHSGYGQHIQLLETSFFSEQQFAFKLRVVISLEYSLQIRIYFNKGHFDYSYQLLNPSPMCRWDNKEHFPGLKTFPHHFHTFRGEIINSPLSGEPISDLKIVLDQLKQLIQI